VIKLTMVKTIYECGICGRSSSDLAAIQACEERGVKGKVFEPGFTFAPGPSFKSYIAVSAFFIVIRESTSFGHVRGYACLDVLVPSNQKQDLFIESNIRGSDRLDKGLATEVFYFFKSEQLEKLQKNIRGADRRYERLSNLLSLAGISPEKLHNQINA
jgi:hypothetical protein